MDFSFTLDYAKSELPVKRQATSGVYNLLQHRKNENAFINMNPNFLVFNDSSLEKKYINNLFCDKQTHSELSEDFKNNLLMFYVFMTGYVLVMAVTTLILYSENKYPGTSFAVQISGFGAILLFLYGILLILKTSKLGAFQCKRLFLIFGLFFSAFLITSERRILAGITGEEELNFQNNMLILVSFTVMFRYLLFDSFLETGIISLFSMLSYFGCFLAFSNDRLEGHLTEVLCITIFLALTLIDTRKADYRTRQLFWRKEKEEQLMNAVGYSNNPPERSNSKFNTDIESILEMCNSVKQEVKKAASVIMFKEVKQNLKRVQMDIEKIKRKLAFGNFSGKVHLDEDLDEQDKEFITENFLAIEVNRRKTEFKRRASMNDIGQRHPTFPSMKVAANEISSVLPSLAKNWNFDIWFVNQVTGKSLSVVGNFLFANWNLVEAIHTDLETLGNFLSTLENEYPKNPYHNACHAADVTHSMLYFLVKGNIMSDINVIESSSAIVAALGHDVGHPAVSNRFLVNTRDELAITYNDSSVLENMHCSKTFQIMKNHNCNIFAKLSEEDWIKARSIVVQMILDTDMSRHFDILAKFRARATTTKNFSIEDFEDKAMILSMSLKCGDLGHAAKSKLLHEKWSGLICEEFFRQGDIEKEKGLPVSTYCDRETTNIAKSQYGFLKNVCLPLYEVWCNFLRSEQITKNCLEQLKRNQEFWESKGIHRNFTIRPGPANQLKKIFTNS